MFPEEEAHALYRLTYAQEKTGKTYYNILPHLEIAQIFTVDHEVERILNQHFPGIRFYHSHTMILEKLWLLAQQDKRQLYAYFDEKEVFVFGYRAQQLCYANTFPADVADNAVYFILSVWKDLKMDVRQEECILLGNGNIRMTQPNSLPDTCRTSETRTRPIFTAVPHWHGISSSRSTCWLYGSM